WMDDPTSAIIVYGTGGDIAANKAAAGELNRTFRIRWWNGDIPMVTDKDATDDILKGKHILLIGRPAVNSITRKMAAAFPVEFAAASVKVNDQLYAHERTAVIVAGVNPHDGRF